MPKFFLTKTFSIVLASVVLLYPYGKSWAGPVVIKNNKHYEILKDGGYLPRPDLDEKVKSLYPQTSGPTGPAGSPPPARKNPPASQSAEIKSKQEPSAIPQPSVALPKGTPAPKNFSEPSFEPPKSKPVTDLQTINSGAWSGLKKFKMKDVQLRPMDTVVIPLYRDYHFDENGGLTVYLYDNNHVIGKGASWKPPVIEYRFIPSDQGAPSLETKNNQLQVNAQGTIWETETSSATGGPFHLRSNQCKTSYQDSSNPETFKSASAFKITKCINKIVIDYGYGSTSVKRRDNSKASFNVIFPPEGKTCAVQGSEILSGSGGAWEQKSEAAIMKVFDDKKHPCFDLYQKYQASVAGQKKINKQLKEGAPAPAVSPQTTSQ